MWRSHLVSKIDRYFLLHACLDLDLMKLSSLLAVCTDVTRSDRILERIAIRLDPTVDADFTRLDVADCARCIPAGADMMRSRLLVVESEYNEPP